MLLQLVLLGFSVSQDTPGCSVQNPCENGDCCGPDGFCGLNEHACDVGCASGPCFAFLSSNSPSSTAEVPDAYTEPTRTLTQETIAWVTEAQSTYESKSTLSTHESKSTISTYESKSTQTVTRTRKRRPVRSAR